MTVRDLGRDLSDLESESSGLLFLHFLCRSPLVGRMRDEPSGPSFHRVLVSFGALPGKDLLLRICMWLLAAFDPHMLQIHGPHLADCTVHLILLLLVNLWQLPPFMWHGMALGNSMRLFLTNCHFWTMVKSRRNCSVSCCFLGFPQRVDTVFLCIGICPSLLLPYGAHQGSCHLHFLDSAAEAGPCLLRALAVLSCFSSFPALFCPSRPR